jgi:16S rRNA (guanine966-N2)-methyltransferase
MRIIAGTAGGIPLKVPQGDTRPTTDRVREALFSMLSDHIENARVLDLFAGSGSLGIEALSRGAASTLFVEQNRAATDVLRANLQKARLQNATLRQGDVFKTLADLAKNAEPSFNLVFADPPYTHRPTDTDFARTLLDSPHLPHLLTPDGDLILECLASKHPFEIPSPWTLHRQRDYGTTRILWLRLQTSTHLPVEPAPL